MSHSMLRRLSHNICNYSYFLHSLNNAALKNLKNIRCGTGKIWDQMLACTYRLAKKLCMQDGMRLAIIYGDGRRENVLHDKIPARMPPPHPPLGPNSGSPLSIHNLNLTLPEKIVGICYVVLCSHYFGCMKWTSQCLLYRGWYQILSSNRG